MELNKTRKAFYIVLLFSVLMLFLLGSWWLFLVFKLANKLEDLNHPLLEGNLLSMIKWEGMTFIGFLLTLTVTLIYIYYQDHKKTKSLQAFFSSLTHELKTPLASIKLQTQVLLDALLEAKLEEKTQAKIDKYTKRLIDDSVRLEDQLDNHLQLSRVERSAPLNLTQIELLEFIQQEEKRYEQEIQVHIKQSEQAQTVIMADSFALQTILRNLFENTIKHGNPDNKQATIDIVSFKDKVQFSYHDNGGPFSGELDKLGELFYKHDSPKGSGIGLYLIKKLMYKMKGKCLFNLNNKGQLILTLSFQGGNSHES